MKKFFQNNFYSVANGLTSQRLESITLCYTPQDKTFSQFKNTRSNFHYKGAAHRHQSVLLADMTRFMSMFGCNIQPPKELLKNRYPQLYHVLMYSIVFPCLDKKKEEKRYPKALSGLPMNCSVIFRYIGYLVSIGKLLMIGFDLQKISRSGWRISIEEPAEGVKTAVRCPDWSELFGLHFHLAENRSLLQRNTRNERTWRYWNSLNDGKGPSFVELATYIVYGVFDAGKPWKGTFEAIDQHLFASEIELLHCEHGLTKFYDESNYEEIEGVPITIIDDDSDDFNGFVLLLKYVRLFFDEFDRILPNEYQFFTGLSSSAKKPSPLLSVGVTEKKELSFEEKSTSSNWGSSAPKLNLLHDSVKKNLMSKSVLKNRNQGNYLSSLQVGLEQSLMLKFHEILQLGKLLPMVCEMKNKTISEGTSQTKLTTELCSEKLLHTEYLSKLLQEKSNLVASVAGVPSHDYHVLFMKLMHMIRDDSREEMNRYVTECKPDEEGVSMYDVQRCSTLLLLNPSRTSVVEWNDYLKLGKEINPGGKIRRNEENDKFRGRDPFAELTSTILTTKAKEEDVRREEMKKLFSLSADEGM